jgi:hypothetical protein
VYAPSRAKPASAEGADEEPARPAQARDEGFGIEITDEARKPNRLRNRRSAAMSRLSDLIIEMAKKEKLSDAREKWVNDYPNGFLFIGLMMLVIFFVSFLRPLLGL